MEFCTSKTIPKKDVLVDLFILFLTTRSLLAFNNEPLSQ